MILLCLFKLLTKEIMEEYNSYLTKLCNSLHKSYLIRVSLLINNHQEEEEEIVWTILLRKEANLQDKL